MMMQCLPKYLPIFAQCSCLSPLKGMWACHMDYSKQTWQNYSTVGCRIFLRYNLLFIIQKLIIFQQVSKISYLKSFKLQFCPLPRCVFNQSKSQILSQNKRNKSDTGFPYKQKFYGCTQVILQKCLKILQQHITTYGVTGRE